MRLVHIAELRDGQCVDTRSYFDELDVMRQLGLMPPVALAASAVVGQLWNRLGRRLQDWRLRARGRT